MDFNFFDIDDFTSYNDFNYDLEFGDPADEFENLTEDDFDWDID